MAGFTNTLIDGWAFSDYSVGERRYKRYLEIKDLNWIEITGKRVLYTKHEYVGRILNPEITAEEILIICDKGNTCFGGYVERSKGSFRAEVYTD